MGLRSRAQDSAAQQDLRNTLTAAKAAAVEHEGNYAAFEGDTEGDYSALVDALEAVEPAIRTEEVNVDASGTVADAIDAMGDDADVAVDVIGGEFVALRASESGKVFIAVDSNERGSAIAVAAEKDDDSTTVTAAIDAAYEEETTPTTTP